VVEGEEPLYFVFVVALVFLYTDAKTALRDKKHWIAQLFRLDKP
jgi:hypothetical protein